MIQSLVPKLNLGTHLFRQLYGRNFLKGAKASRPRSLRTRADHNAAWSLLPRQGAVEGRPVPLWGFVRFYCRP